MGKGADQIHELVGDIGQEAHIALAVGKAPGLKDAQLETARLGERLREGFVARHCEDHTHLITPVAHRRPLYKRSNCSLKAANIVLTDMSPADTAAVIRNPVPNVTMGGASDRETGGPADR